MEYIAGFMSNHEGTEPMKKVWFALGVILFVSSIYFTGRVSAKYTPPVKLPGEVLIGKIDSVAVRETPQGKVQQVAVRDAEGLQTVFVIAPDATITGKDGSSTSLNWLKGNKVSVRYVIGPDGYTKMVKAIQEI